MTLRRRIVLVLTVFAALLFVDAAVGVQAARQREQVLTQLETIVQPARETTSDLLDGLVDQELGLRGYVLTGEPAFLDSYRDGRSSTDTALEKLRALLGDEPLLRSAVDDVAASMSRWQTEVAAPQLEAATDARGSEGTGLVDSAPGSALFESARADIRELDALVNTRQAEALARLRVAQQRLVYTAVAAAAAALLLTIGVAWLLNRWIGRPIEGLLTSVDSVASGTLDADIPQSGPRELAALGHNVDHMRRRLLAELDEAVRARQALEQHGPAVVSLRAALNTHGEPLPGWLAAAAAFAPARGVLAGDWYDVLALGEGSVAVAVMDVSGHGPTAGVMALRAKELLGAALRTGHAPGEALEFVATNLGDTGERFLTCFVAVLGSDGPCYYASAGHPPAVLVDEAGLERFEPTGPLLGPLEGGWKTSSCALPEGSKLFAYTDGLVEARNEEGVQFGAAHLDEVLEAHRTDTAAELVRAVSTTIADFSSGAFADDLTVVAVARETDASKTAAPTEVQTYPVAANGSTQRSPQG